MHNIYNHLLRATLLQGDEALTAWATWRSQANFDQPEPGVFALLPLLYHNLHQQGVSDPWLEICKGIQRRTWYKNQLILAQVTQLMRVFQQAGIDTLLLKDVPLALCYYPKPGLRQINSIDLWVPTVQLAAAGNLLQAEGWAPPLAQQPRLTQQGLFVPQVQQFTQGEDLICNLNAYMLQDNWTPALDIKLWEASVLHKVNDVTVRTLQPTDQLLHICADGLGQASAGVALQWISDAWMVLHTAAETLDWARLLKTGEERALVLRLQHALSYLAETFQIAVLAPVRAPLHQLPIQKFEQQEAQAYRHWSTWGKAQALWAGYQRQQWFLQKTAGKHWGISLAQYCQTVFALDSAWQLPFGLSQAIMRHLRYQRSRFA